MSFITINKRKIGPDFPVYIIAETSCTHKSDPRVYLKMIKEAARVGVDAIKFQTFKADKLVTRSAPRYASDKKFKDTQYQMFKNANKLTEEDYRKIISTCKKYKITFFSSAWDEESVDLLDSMGIPAFKVGSADITYHDLLRHIAKKGKPIILSVGASTTIEIKEAIDIIFSEGNKELALLHCVLAYPTPDEQANLKKIEGLKKEFPGFVVGYSDHTKPDKSVIVPTLAVALGASIIEKHYALDKTYQGDDSRFSADTANFKVLVENIRLAEKSLGSEKIRSLSVEDRAKLNARRSIVTLINIKKGEVIKKSMITAKRPGNGVSAKYINFLSGKVAKNDIKEDTSVKDGDFEKKTVAIIQARMDAKRLPGKPLLKFKQRTMMELLVERLMSSEEIDEIVIATSNKESDLPVVEEGRRLGIRTFRGSEEDVLERMKKAAELSKADIIVRVTADNPLTNAKMIDQMVRELKTGNLDYIHNRHVSGLPRGVGAEVFTYQALEKLDKLSYGFHHREHVTIYLFEYPDEFKIGTFIPPENLDLREEYRLTVDTPEDFELMKKIFKAFTDDSNTFSLSATLRFLRENPLISKKNQKTAVSDYSKTF